MIIIYNIIKSVLYSRVYLKKKPIKLLPMKPYRNLVHGSWVRGSGPLLSQAC